MWVLSWRLNENSDSSGSRRATGNDGQTVDIISGSGTVGGLENDGIKQETLLWQRDRATACQ